MQGVHMQNNQTAVRGNETNTVVDIDQLPVSASWKTRFKIIHNAGGPRLPFFRQMPLGKRIRAHFNILAGLFGPFYYIAKGMWKKGLALFMVCFSALIVLSAILDMIGYAFMAQVLGYGVAGVYASRANIDYYKKMILKDNGWW
jgi:hypothetical protein